MLEKLTNRQIQAQKTQDRVYNTAVELMEQKGFQNITVEEICKKAGVSVGTFYNCFKSKNDIIDVVFKVADDFFREVVEEKLKKEKNIHDKIVEYFRCYAEYNNDRGIEFIKQLYNVQNNLFVTKGRYMQAVLDAIIDEGQKSGQISGDMSPPEIVEYLFIAVRGVIYNWCLHDGKFNLSEFTANYVKRLVAVFLIAEK